MNKQDPLYCMAAYGATEIVRMLLEEVRVDVDEGYNGKTALWIASENGFEEIVRLLLHHGADTRKCHALQAASYRSHIDVMKVLLEKGADPHAQGGHHGNALQAASRFGNIDALKLLLEKGADPNMQGGKDGTALRAALKRGSEQAVKLLLEYGARDDSLSADELEKLNAVRRSA